MTPDIMTESALLQLEALYREWIDQDAPYGPTRVTQPIRALADKMHADAGLERALWDASRHEQPVGEVLLDVHSSLYITQDGDNLRYWIKSFDDDIFGTFAYYDITNLKNWSQWVFKLNHALMERMAPKKEEEGLDA